MFRRAAKIVWIDFDDKVITTMVISSLDDRTRYAQSVVADLQTLGLGYVGSWMGAFGSSPMGSYYHPFDT